MTQPSKTALTALISVLLSATFLQGCGGGGARNELSTDEVHVRASADGLAAPDGSGWVGSLGSSIVNFDMPWSSRESDSSNAYINTMFHRRFDSQEARYAAMVDDALRAELALEAFAVSAAEVAQGDEERLAGLISLMASGQATDEDMLNSMDRVRRNRAAVSDGLTEAQSWTQTFAEVRDRAEMELPGSAQAGQLAQSVTHMNRWTNELAAVTDRMETSAERVAAQFGGGQ